MNVKKLPVLYTALWGYYIYNMSGVACFTVLVFVTVYRACPVHSVENNSVLFSSFPFLFLFLPIAFSGAYILFRKGHNQQGIAYLVVCSLFFYAYWHPPHLWVIVGSIIINYFLSGVMVKEDAAFRRKILLIVGLAFNLSLLGYFKYLGFFSHMFTESPQGNFFDMVVNTALPIGISFYTFQQIAFLVDCYANHRRRPYPFIEYMFFVSFFPQLIAGPIVHHSEIMPQLSHLAERLRGARYVTKYLAPGIALLIIGLAKKILLADSFGTYAQGAFDLANIARVTFFDAWGSAVAYTLQIYFDFSGYSDMAIGLAFLVGLRLPINFNAPYKATSIIEFWRRWHMTLSRFLKDYLYIPLGGSRKGMMRRYLHLLVTMALGGLWHGANWTFVFWGVLHGTLLVINHGARRFIKFRLPGWLSIGVTFLIIVFTWVPFRAEGFDVVMRFYSLMLGFDGIVVPLTYASLVSGLGDSALLFGLRVGDLSFFGGVRQVLFTIGGLAIVFFAPNSMALLKSANRRRMMRSHLVPIGLGTAVGMVLLVMWMQANVTFLYFQF